MNGERLYLLDDPEMGIVAEKDPDVIARHKRRYEWAASVVDGHAVVDAGCGTGYGWQVLKSPNYLGVDNNEAAICYASTHYPAQFRMGDLVSAWQIAHRRGAWLLFIESLEHVRMEEQWRAWQPALEHGVPVAMALPVRMERKDPPSMNPHHVHEPALTWLLPKLLCWTPWVEVTLERYESTYGPAVQALVVARPK